MLFASYTLKYGAQLSFALQLLYFTDASKDHRYELSRVTSIYTSEDVGKSHQFVC